MMMGMQWSQLPSGRDYPVGLVLLPSIRETVENRRIRSHHLVFTLQLEPRDSPLGSVRTPYDNVPACYSRSASAFPRCTVDDVLHFDSAQRLC